MPSILYIIVRNRFVYIGIVDFTMYQLHIEMFMLPDLFQVLSYREIYTAASLIVQCNYKIVILTNIIIISRCYIMWRLYLTDIIELLHKIYYGFIVCKMLINSN